MTEVGLVLFAVFLLVLIGLDVAMLVSLVRPGDERRKMIVWKASTWTLLGTMGAMVVEIAEDLLRGQALANNPFTQLGATAIIYFLALLYYKKKYGD